MRFSMRDSYYSYVKLEERLIGRYLASRDSFLAAIDAVRRRCSRMDPFSRRSSFDKQRQPRELRCTGAGLCRRRGVHSCPASLSVAHTPTTTTTTTSDGNSDDECARSRV